MDDWEPPLPAGYNDANRAFLQAFMARGSLTLVEAQKLLAEIKSAATGEPVDSRSVTTADFENHVRTAREAVSGLDFDILNMKHQARGGERVWALVNAHSDPATQMATTRTPEEVAYIKRLLDAMFEEHNTPRMEVMAVDEAQAIKASRPSRQQRESAAHAHVNGEDGESAAGPVDRGLKHSEVLALLSSLVAEGWLEKSRDGFYSLSPRSLMELMSWLMATYNDPDSEDEWQHIKFCEACKEIITYGQRCTERDCTVRIHDICAEAYFRARRETKCPRCQTAWDGNHFASKMHAADGVGEEGGASEWWRRRRGRTMMMRNSFPLDFTSVRQADRQAQITAAMLEYFAYKKYKKNKAEKEEKGKETGDVTSTSAGTSTPRPVLADDDERFLERLTSTAVVAHDENDDDRPALPPRVKTPDLTWDSDSESFVRSDAAPKDKDKKSTANRLSLLLRNVRRKSSSSSPSDATTNNNKNSSSLTVPVPEADRERDDLTRVLDDLNLAARNNKAFALSTESSELVGKFTLVLKDLVNGVPTAAHDLTHLLDDTDGTLAKNYEKLPKSLKKLVTQLPDKIKSNLGPELLAVAAEAQGLGAADAAAKGGMKGAAKRMLTPSNLKDLVTRPGAVVSMLKAIMNALKLRWPAFIGTNVLWSLALFLLLFVLWYCHKRGRETRLEKEKTDAEADGKDTIDGSSRIEELPDDPTLPAAGTPVVVEPPRDEVAFAPAPRRSGSGRIQS
ncbi:RING-like domain-containing protein [Podospora didyma]|uniref:Non-structural maintenance of chromosomes element 1 homolog n=1 Tax=Podospora didyma TaxID=330526 RepID=A0AAE0U4G8_9PEZI|nr:RING-like domain-containing protein [Podospora didyma]